MNWTPHTTDCCPCDPDALVAVDLGDGEVRVDRADAWGWGAGAGPAGEGRIVRYARLSTLLPAAAGTAAATVD